MSKAVRDATDITVREAVARPINAMADAIDAARYAHPARPRERERLFAEADRSDREYAFRLARAAYAALSASSASATRLALGDTAYAKVRIDTEPVEGCAFVTPSHPKGDIDRGLAKGAWNEGAQFFGEIVSAPPAASGGLEAVRKIAPSEVVAWAVEQWNAQVKNRPLVNVHRRSLDDAWRRVMREFGGDPEGLVGPSHDELRAACVPSPKDGGHLGAALAVPAATGGEAVQDERLLRQLRALAVALHAKHYANDGSDWRPLDDAEGLLSQIDNMACGLGRITPAASPEEEINHQRALAHEELANDVLGWLNERGLYDPRDYEHEGPNVADILTEHEEELLRTREQRTPEEILTALTHPAPSETGASDNWQDISTAPKDENATFIACEGPLVYQCGWQIEDDGEGRRREGWYDFENQSFENPTLWQPFPKPRATLASATDAEKP